jgi:threonine dehydrogenase-like Zn-dependent dehydrogenase
MRAMTVVPLRAGSLAVSELPEPRPATGELLVDGIALGVCGTDREIVSGHFGRAPAGQEKLILGHESLGRVREAPDGSGFTPGDLVVGIVRRPDPVPCACCARGEFDMCRNGQFTERGLEGLHGYGSQVWTVEADYAVKLDRSLEAVGMLLEPTSVVAKMWEQIERIGARAQLEPGRALIVGAGPVGLLAALLGVQRGLEMHVLDRVEDGRKPRLVRALGGIYHNTSLSRIARATAPDVIIEATGDARLAFDAMANNAPTGIVCLLGVPPGGREIGVDAGSLARSIVNGNGVIFGSVNANHRHYETGSEALGRADRSWLERLITRRVPLDDAVEAFKPSGDEVKVVIDL